MALHIPSNILPYITETPELAATLVDEAYLPTPLARDTVEGLLAVATRIEATSDNVHLKAAISKLKIQAVLLSSETREYLEELGLGLAQHQPCLPCPTCVPPLLPCAPSPAPSVAPVPAPSTVAAPPVRPLTPVSALVVNEGCGENCQGECKHKCSHKCLQCQNCTCNLRCGRAGCYDNGCRHRCRAHAHGCGDHAHGHGHARVHGECHATFRKRYAELKEQYARRHRDLKATYETKYANLKTQYAEREQEIKCKYDERHHAIKVKFNDLKRKYEARGPRCQ